VTLQDIYQNNVFISSGYELINAKSLATESSQNSQQNPHLKAFQLTPLVFHCSYVPFVYHFLDIVSYFPKQRGRWLKKVNGTLVGECLCPVRRAWTHARRDGRTGRKHSAPGAQRIGRGDIKIYHSTGDHKTPWTRPLAPPTGVVLFSRFSRHFMTRSTE